MRKNNEFLFRMRELKTSDEEVKRLAEGIEKMAVAYPGVAISNHFEKGYYALAEAMEAFRALGTSVLNEFLKEGFDFQKELGLVESRAKTARNIFRAVEEYSRKNPDSASRAVIERLDYNCDTVDEYVHGCNRAVFELAKDGKWIDDDSLKYKQLYVELIETAKRLYNVIPMVVVNWKNYIRKTKNVKGELLRADAELPSATDNCKYSWMTELQWLKAMNPSEIKNNPDFKERMMEMHWQRMREEYEARMGGNRFSRKT